MLKPGIGPGECLNYKTCGSALELSPDEEIELIRAREERWELFRTTRRQAAIMMLMQRACPATAQSLGVTEQVEAIATTLQQLQERLNGMSGQYIAPLGCEVHRYSVKRPSGVYVYNKLTAKEPIFKPSELEDNVKVLHLSHDDDPRNTEARLGIERRNKLTHVRTLLERAAKLLHLAALDSL